MTEADEAEGSRTRTENRRKRGIEVYAGIFDVSAQEVPAVLAGIVGSVFADEALQAAGGAGWFHPGLTSRERSLVVITALACQGVAGKRLRTHIRLGMRHGLDEDAFTGLAAMLAGYVGYPRASLVMETIKDESAHPDGAESPE